MRVLKRSVRDAKRLLTGGGYTPRHLGCRTKATIYGCYDLFESLLRDYYDKFSPTLVVSGISPGWESCLATIAIERKIPLIVVFPYRGWVHRGQSTKRDKVRKYLEYAEQVYYMTNYYAPDSMQKKTEFLIDQLSDNDRYVTIYSNSSGGNARPFKYAEMEDKSDLIEVLDFDMSQFNVRKYKKR